jgi:hypothetical protein
MKMNRVILYVGGDPLYAGRVVKARIYQPYFGEGLPKRPVWKRDGKYIYFRCTCSKINRNTPSTFATKANVLARSAIKKLGIRDIGVLYRCIRCNHCGKGLSGVVLLGFKNPQTFLKKKRA